MRTSRRILDLDYGASLPTCSSPYTTFTPTFDPTALLPRPPHAYHESLCQLPIKPTGTHRRAVNHHHPSSSTAAVVAGGVVRTLSRRQPLPMSTNELVVVKSWSSPYHLPSTHTIGGIQLDIEVAFKALLLALIVCLAQKLLPDLRCTCSMLNMPEYVVIDSITSFALPFVVTSFCKHCTGPDH